SGTFIASFRAARAVFGAGVSKGHTRGSVRVGSATATGVARRAQRPRGTAGGHLRSYNDVDLDECAAARRAPTDRGAAPLKFKRDHVVAAYRANNQFAIETFRTLFIATGYLLCPDVDSIIRPAAMPLL